MWIGSITYLETPWRLFTLEAPTDINDADKLRIAYRVRETMQAYRCRMLVAAIANDGKFSREAHAGRLRVYLPPTCRSFCRPLPWSVVPAAVQCAEDGQQASPDDGAVVTKENYDRPSTVCRWLSRRAGTADLNVHRR